MKRISSSLGVTLLEIMLVLAIAAMVIVMSVRYYQSANTAQQTNATLELIQAITAAADSLAQGTGSYASVSSTDLTSLVSPGATAITTAWGSAVTFAPAANSTTQYTVTIATVPQGVCAGLKARLAANAHFSATANTCSGTGTFTYTYTSNV